MSDVMGPHAGDGTNSDDGDDVSGATMASLRTYLAKMEQNVGLIMRQSAEHLFDLSEAERRHAAETQRILLEVIEVQDALLRVFGNIQSKPDLITPQMRIWIGNFRAAQRRLTRILSSHDVTQIGLGSGSFDPHLHTIEDIILDATRPEGTIQEEVAPGYRWQGTVLRKATVIVVRHPEATTGAR